MKNLLSFLCILGLCSLMNTNSYAQTDVFDEATAVAAQSICDCANKTFDMEKDVEEAFVHMIKLNDEKAANNYLLSLPEEMQLGVTKAAMNMQNMDGDDGFNQCILGIGAALKPYEDQLDKEKYTEADFQKAIINKLSTSKTCQLTYLLVQMSLAIEDDNTNVNTTKTNENNDPRYGSGGN